MLTLAFAKTSSNSLRDTTERTESDPKLMFNRRPRSIHVGRYDHFHTEMKFIDLGPRLYRVNQTAL